MGLDNGPMSVFEDIKQGLNEAIQYEKIHKEGKSNGNDKRYDTAPENSEDCRYGRCSPEE